MTVTAPGSRGRLKVYLGAAPGSGKTFAMLREGRDRREDGEDVVIGLVETHGRPRTRDAIGTLEVVPRLEVEYRGAQLSDMDVDAVIARHPDVALVDELAHTNAPPLRNDKRWRDIEQIRDAGIDVISTMNVQHLESVKDLVEHITGIRVQETVPDDVLDRADEIRFIDITPEALRKRMTHGNIYGPERAASALRNFFRPGNLAALREIALRLVAERVGSDSGGVRSPPEDVLVAVSGRATAEQLIRRASRIARKRRGFCTIVHVHEHRTSPDADDVVWRRLAGELQCGVVERDGGDIAAAIIAAARDRQVRHVVLGEPRQRPTLPWRATLVDRVIDTLADVDIHVIARHGHLLVEDDPDRPDPDALLRHLHHAHARGSLRLYLGYAPGVGATTAMLDEARRRKSRGTDVVVASLSPGMAAAAADLPVLGGGNGSAAHGLLDVSALLNRNPDVAAVDDLAGRTVAGEVVADVITSIRDAGITVIGTVLLTDLQSTGARMRALVERDDDRPVIADSVVDAADELELVDVLPEELVERVLAGEVMAPSEAQHALQSGFRPSVLASLREMAFRRVAQHTDKRLVSYMASERIAQPWEARPRVLVMVPPRPGRDRLITTATRIAAIRDDAITAISVRRRHRSDADKQLLGHYAALTHRLGGRFVTVDGDDVATTVAAWAQANGITEIIAMRSHTRPSRSLRRLVRLLADVDVHILAGENGTDAAVD